MTGENEQQQPAVEGGPVADPETGVVAGVNRLNDENVTQPHPESPGFGVTGKFPTQDADVPDDDGAADPGTPIVTSEPASETDALVAPAQGPVTVEQPAADADQLDVPHEQRSDTA